MQYRFDFVVVGGGIVGLATARELKHRHPDASIVILEKEDAPGRHASGRNSGVMHSGVYYGADSLKARVCARGAARMADFAREHGIAWERSGKVILGTRLEDAAGLDRLEANARANGIRVERLDDAGVRALEPHASPVGGGLHCPDTAIIDGHGVLHRMQELLEAEGVALRFGQRVERVDPDRRRVGTPGGEIAYGFLISCAGAFADTIARPFGLADDLALVPFKGLYYKLRADRRDLVRANLYPVPDPAVPFLGVHLTRVVSGEVYVGPTAIPALGRENYGLLEGLQLGEATGILARLARMYAENRQGFRTHVHAEVRKYLKPAFVEAARRLVNEVTAEDLVPCDKVGIRPQLINTRTRTLEMDFVLRGTDTSLHVLNAISPAFTSAFAFAELVVDRIEGKAGAAPP